MTKKYQIPRDILNMAHATSDNPSRLALTSVHFGKGYTAATDGHQAMVRKNGPEEQLPEDTSWVFSGKKLKGKDETFPFKVLDNQAVDMTGNTGGNATVVDSVITYPNVPHIFPKEITKDHHIVAIDVKVLAKLAKAMFGPTTKGQCQIISMAFPKDNSESILVAPLNDEKKIGIIMPCRDNDKREKAPVVASFNHVIGGLNNEQ